MFFFSPYDSMETSLFNFPVADEYRRRMINAVATDCIWLRLEPTELAAVMGMKA